MRDNSQSAMQRMPSLLESRHHLLHLRASLERESIQSKYPSMDIGSSLNPAVGAKLSWKKGKYSQCIDSTGTTTTVRPLLGFTAVRIEIHQHKASALLVLTAKLSLKEDLVDIKEGLLVAGALGWAGGLFPWLVTLFSALWAAVMSHRESQQARGKPTTRKWLICFLFRNCISLDQGFAVGSGHARRCCSFWCHVFHSRQNHFAQRPLRGGRQVCSTSQVPHSQWPKKSMGTIPREWPPCTATWQREWELLAVVCVCRFVATLLATRAVALVQADGSPVL